MSLLWIIVEISVNFVEVLLFLLIINSKFPNKTQSIMPAIFALLFCTIGVSCIGLLHITWFPEYIFEPLVMLIYALVTRGGIIRLKLFWSVLGISLICLVNYMGIVIELLIPGLTLDLLMRPQTIVRFQFLVLCKLLQLIVTVILIKRESFNNLKSGSIILLIIAPVMSIVTITVQVEYGLGPVSSSVRQLLLASTCVSILLINIILFVLYESLSRQAKNNLQMQANLQRYDMLISHYEEIKSIYDEIRGFWHDYHNHLQVVNGYLELQQYEKLKKYLHEIEDSMGGIEMRVNSGNMLIDAIVSSKLLLIKNQNISVSVNIYVPPVLSISDIDMCILLGNLLDNAIEACQRMTGSSAKRFIEIDLKTIKGQLHITVRNSTNGILRMVGSHFLSDKRGKYHGIGIRNIDEITNKYDGYINRKHENCVFETNIMFPIEQACQNELQILNHTDISTMV